MNLFYLISAMAIGIAFAAQPAINGAVGKIVGSPLTAAALSITITLACTLILMPLMAGRVSLATFTQLPWWVILGGLIGVLVVAGGAAIAPITGVTLFFVCMIAGQLIGSLVLDHYGAFGLAVQQISWVKLTGVGLALAGVVLVRIG